MNCCHESRCAAGEQFGPAIAARDLKRYRQKGPDAPSRWLVDSVAKELKTGDTLLDIGGGVGVLSFELLSRGARTATLVDASPAYLEAAGQEAERRHLSEGVQRIAGDFTTVSDRIDAADVVTMNRVVCCYPDYSVLLKAAATRARRVFAFSYPRARWLTWLWVSMANTIRRLRGNSFRAFVHSPAAMDALVVGEGFRKSHQSQTVVWSMHVYVRTDA
ncbi:MAG TPA: methyltransferase domain-containing protein [Vicinamibacterales bacterium]|nr:methyltransferase domain-containing protein [Vicinamibacterales bacterium]